MLNHYKQKADIAKTEGIRLRKQSDRLSFLRLIVFIVGVGIFVLCCSQTWQLALGFVFVFLFGFARFVAFHQRIESQATHYEHLSFINAREIQFLNHDIQGFDTGESFINPEHPYSVDLDIFGQYSLFQYINRTSTAMGEKRLAAMLQYPATPQEIALRQGAFAELSQKEDWRQA
jgi:hypothetical protein